MDQKITLLAGFCAVSTEGKVSPDIVRDFRDILSLFSGEIIAEDEYLETIGELRDEKYIQESAGLVTITREGWALSESVFGRLVGQTNFENFHRMLADYKKEPKAYLNKISVNIKSLQSRHENKAKDESLSQCQAVGIVLGIEHKVDSLFLHRIKINSNLLRDDDALTKEINTSTHRFSKNTGFPIIATRRDPSELELISLVPVKNFRLFSEEIEIRDIRGIGRDRVYEWNKTVTAVYLEHALQSFGYIRSQWPGRNFVKFADYKLVDTNVGCIRECPALETDIEEMTNGDVFVWLQSYVSPSKRLVDFIKESSSQYTSEELSDALGNLKLRSIPSGSELQVKSILLGKDMTQEHIPGMGLSYIQFWKEMYGVELGEKIQPIVIVEGKGTDYHYPAEMIFVDRYSLEKYQKKSIERQTRAESPKQRADKSKEFFRLLKKYQNPSWAQSVQIQPKECNPTLAYLQNGGAIERALRIHQPMLEFRSGAVSLDPSNIFKSEYGAKCGQRAISLSHFFAPTSVPDNQIDTFLNGLQRTFSFAGFGRITKSPKVVITKFNENDKTDLENNIRTLDRLGNVSNHLGMIVIPDGHPELYFTAKRLVPSRIGVPIQAVQLSSFIEAQDDRFRGFRLLSLKILIKSLRRGEAIWTLSDNAGLLTERTLYVGIGYSAFPREGRVSKCAAVLHDSRGNKVSWKVFATVQTRTINKQWFDTLLHHIREVVESEKPERLMFYRTGTMFPVELDAINSSLIGCAWLKPIETCFVSILDAGNHRFFLSESHKNLPAGYSVLLNAREGLISSSNYDDRELRQGTIIPVRLRLEFGNESILNVLKEYHDLTYLNWPAPYTTAKHPLLITIAERFAELTRENVSAENMFYLDL